MQDAKRRVRDIDVQVFHYSAGQVLVPEGRRQEEKTKCMKARHPQETTRAGGALNTHLRQPDLDIALMF